MRVTFDFADGEADLAAHVFDAIAAAYAKVGASLKSAATSVAQAVETRLPAVSTEGAAATAAPREEPKRTPFIVDDLGPPLSEVETTGKRKRRTKAETAMADVASPATPAPAVAAPAPTVATAVTKDDVRAACAALAGMGRGDKINGVFKGYGNLTEVPADKYPELLAKLNEAAA